MNKIVIIGNGISGVTCARHIRKKSDDEIVIISSETKYFYSRTALMYVFMGHMKFEQTQPYENWFWQKNRIDLIQAKVEQIAFLDKQLTLDNGTTVHYDKLVLALGSKPNKIGWPGQDSEGVQGLYHKQDLDRLEEHCRKNTVKQAVIVGGGLIGIELAEMLHSRGISVTFLVREKRFWGSVLPKGEGELIERHLLENHIDLQLSTELASIQGDGTGKVKSITTKAGEKIDCQFVGLAIGVAPNIDFLRGTALNTNRGIIVSRQFETNQPDVYAIGDCAEFSDTVKGRRSIEQVWYTGRIMGETLAQIVLGHDIEYHPGNWFNSAKFFDIEYQTYGWVYSELQENEDDFYWEHPKGKKCMHFVFDRTSHQFLGVNTFGIRLRHEVMDAHLTKQSSIEKVLTELKNANFDPEFYRQYEKEILDAFNMKFGTQIKPKKRNWAKLLAP